MCTPGPPSHLPGVPGPDTHPSSPGKGLSHSPLCEGLPPVRMDMLPGSRSPALPFGKKRMSVPLGMGPQDGEGGEGCGVMGDSGSPQTWEKSQHGQDQTWPSDTRRGSQRRAGTLLGSSTPALKDRVPVRVRLLIWGVAASVLPPRLLSLASRPPPCRSLTEGLLRSVVLLAFCDGPPASSSPHLHLS